MPVLLSAASRLRNWRRTVLAAGAACCWASPALPAEFTEYEVKAGFIYNFMRMTEWPDGTRATLDFCIAGEDPFGPARRILQGKKVQGADLHVRVVPSGGDLRQCQVVFVPASQAQYLDALLAPIRDQPVLTIGDTEGYAARGVVINFYRDADKVRFEINREAARRSGLQISSRLLNLARIVQPPMHAQ